jgi:glycosyltransferase involved in cell wall biosynthesis
MGYRKSMVINCAEIQNIIGLKKLVVISHTDHQIHPTKGPVGWGPTVREINFLADSWEEVAHVACLESRTPIGSSIQYTRNNIKFIPIPTFGGKRWWQKIDIIYKMPIILYAVHKALRGATEVQIRLPMGLGIFLIPYFKWYVDRKFTLWVKFATNWGQASKSISSRWQQQILKKNWLNCPVTINGAWPNQPKHCKTFENPCLTDNQYTNGAHIASAKSLGPPYTVIFIGQVDIEKGVDLIIESLDHWPHERIAMFHIVGEGPLLIFLIQKLEKLKIPVISHGFITQEDIFDLLVKSHFLILPSQSEGFPKVVAEGLNFGCLPIVSCVGSIPYYIKNGLNGFLITERNSEFLQNTVESAMKLPPKKHINMIAEGRYLAEKFTFSSYLNRLKKEVFFVS